MPIPPPDVGLVIRYGYLWRWEADRGRDGAKERPACLVAAVARGDAGPIVVILPITHRQPAAGTPVIELPPKVKAHLGLDAEPAWVILSECNLDVWPSPDLALVPGKPSTYAYGRIPPRLFARIRDRFVETVKARRMTPVRRGEHPGSRER